MPFADDEDRKRYRHKYYVEHASIAIAAAREYRERDPAGSAAYMKNWRENNKDKIASHVAKRREARQALRDETFAAYGGECVCCGEREPLFLTIDHKLSDGAEERKKGRRTGHAFYSWLKKSGWPRDRYQLLCWNCNCGRARNGGRCPHEADV